jgi:hypothetical protein
MEDPFVEIVTLHFQELKIDELRDIRINNLKRILGSPSLCLLSEGHLAGSVVSLDPEYSGFVEYVEWRNSSADGASKVLRIILLPNINWRMWQSICR